MGARRVTQESETIHGKPLDGHLDGKLDVSCGRDGPASRAQSPVLDVGCGDASTGQFEGPRFHGVGCPGIGPESTVYEDDRRGGPPDASQIYHLIWMRSIPNGFDGPRLAVYQMAESGAVALRSPTHDRPGRR